MNMREIEHLTKHYAAEHDRLRQHVLMLEQTINRLKLKRLRYIREAAYAAAASRNALETAIDDNRSLFKRPRSYVFHGVRVGIHKGKGELRWRDTARVIKLIRKHFTRAAAATLIKVTEKPIKKALAALAVADLEKIGVNVTRAGDQVLVKPVDSEIDKLVDALLKDTDRDSDEEAA